MDLDVSYEQMKRAESNVELVRFHKKNLGMMKPSHPAYLEVSTEVVRMLDQIILTFVYVESLRQKQHRHVARAPLMPPPPPGPSC
ncbi:hypothetical protein J3R82DRAFT_7480 [Butyriboletus roseoflavus]|nr:hypothetical protein J3R82DRAFT_7480 [Butyriboletus roseoflavus]